MLKDNCKTYDPIYHNPWNMPPTPGSHSLGAAELTQKFKRQTEDLIKASSPRNSWVTLVPSKPQRVQTVLQLNTEFEFDRISLVNKDQGSLSPSERVMVANTRRNDVEKETLPSFSADSFLKLHALCSTSTSSIEMIRM